LNHHRYITWHIAWLLVLMLYYAQPVPAKPGTKSAPVSISMIYSNAIDKTLPYTIFNNKRWDAAPDASYVKLHLYFDKPVKIHGLVLDTCKPLKFSHFWVFFNFNEITLDVRKRYASGRIDYKATYDKNIISLTNFSQSVEARSLTFNFEKNKAVSVCGIRLLQRNGKPYDVVVPALEPGTADATSTLAPAEDNSVYNLFDSRFEKSWNSDPNKKDAELVFSFNRPVTITKLRLWNGNQQSEKQCIANARAKILVLLGDKKQVGSKNGKPVFKQQMRTIAAKDMLGSQVLTLDKPVVTKTLRLRITQRFAGQNDILSISELRFFNGKNWFMPDTLARQQALISAYRKQFASARLANILNRGLIRGGSDDLESSRLRLRADGSFYLSGSNFDESNTPITFYALGTYQVVSADKKTGVKLKLSGLFYETQLYGDCNGCGRDCNLVKGDDEYRVFTETVQLSRAKRNRYKLHNLSKGQQLPFTNKILRIER